MSTTVEAKQALVAEVAEVAKTAQCAVAAEYRGLTVGEMTQLRAAARASGAGTAVRFSCCPGAAPTFGESTRP